MAFDPRAALLACVAQPDADLAEAALWLAVEDDAGVDPAPWLALLDEIAAELGPRIGGAELPATGLAAVIATTVRDRLRLRGADGSHPRHHYLNSILENGAANPIGCSTVWIALGRRAGLPVEGVGLPGHFLVRVAGTLVDAHGDGAPVDIDQARSLVARVSGDEVGDIAPWLAATGVREVVARMSRNLRALYTGRQEWALALRAADRCVALLPEAPGELRERGTLRLRLGLTGGAMRDLRRYLDGVPDDAPDRARVERAYASARGMLN
ncbi:MAG: tetratricopeptide repeat protein [Chloroflexi bacterium]|nr:MAG: tetratricopeptide repeat protein [Chloroflexota bacterium]